MELDDYLETEVGVAVAATAMVLSPQVPGWLRTGAVYLLAGGIRLGDTVAAAARGMAHRVQRVTATGASAVQETVQEARTTGRAGKASRAKTEG